MKTRLIILTTILLSTVACEQELKVYDQPEGNRLLFKYEVLGGVTEVVTHHTFAYDPSSKTIDTVWVTVGTMGYITDYDRPVAFRQLQTDSINAVAGKHFVAFNDAQLSASYRVPAGQSSARIPIVIMRDAQLKSEEVMLKFAIAPNEHFKLGIPAQTEKLIVLSDMLTQPKYWNMYATYYFAGNYGKVKHQFMIDAAAPLGIKIDDDFFFKLVGDPYNVDMGLTDYWFLFFSRKLSEENARREALGLGLLREAPTAANPQGELVEFTQYMF